MAKGEIARFVQFFFCHYVFKKPSAVEASESIYMRERVKIDMTLSMHIYIYIYILTRVDTVFLVATL